VSGASSLDIRLPIGGLFVVLGLLVGGYGLVTAGDAARYAVSEGLNINLWWGLVMLVFGLLMLALSAGRGGSASSQPAGASAQGRATEAREHRLGLEHEGGER
jgi:uncharacterized membrane protein YbhN (UPF0104 family)